MKILNEEQVFGLRLNTYSNIWTTGFIELHLDETYSTPFGILQCKPGIGWHFSGTFYSKSQPVQGIMNFKNTYLLTEFLQDHNIKYAFDCPILRKLHKRKTRGIIFKLLGYPHNVKCWF